MKENQVLTVFTKTRLIKLLFTASIFTQSTYQAFAQRGAESSDDIKVSNTSPLQGYPGYFDSYLAAEGKWVIDLPPLVGTLPIPSSTLDYGLNDRVTIGTNMALDALPLFLSGLGLTGKIRVLVYGDDDIQSTFTAYGGYMSFGLFEGNRSSFFDYQHFTSNTTFYINRRNLLTFQLGALRANLQAAKRTSISYFSLSTLMGTTGLAYQLMLTKRLTLNAAGMIPLYQKIDLDSAGVSIGIESADATKIDSTLFRFLRAGVSLQVKEMWVFDFGIAHMPPFTEGTLWFGSTVKF